MAYNKKLIHTLQGKTGDKNWKKQGIVVDYFDWIALRQRERLKRLE
ncbi:MAG: hypothetical protein K1X81_05665 [Bacteroidia bacterium]|nr:hypothetical protein [Bacteroidia bacterium]